MSALPTHALPPKYGPIHPRGVRRFTVEEYHHMIKAGFFAHNERFELLEGYIVPKMPRDRIHDATVDIILELLRARLPSGWRARGQSAVTTADSEPEPDIAVIRGSPREYLQRHPGPQDAAVIIEVANTSLRDDRLFKGRVYARASVSEYWIVNLVDRQIEVYQQPSGEAPEPQYTSRQDYKPGAAITLRIPGHDPIELNVAEMLP